MLVKWVGGKRWLVPELAPRINTVLDSTQGNYFEPFLGGGAMARALGRAGHISDSCEELICMWLCVKHDWAAVGATLGELERFGTDKEAYLEVRAGRPTHADPFHELAAWFIYINRLGFNGLWRVNKEGKCNVPYGDGKGRLPTTEELQEVSKSIKGYGIECCDYQKVVGHARAGDVVFADPPYWGTFSGYSAEGFGEHDQEALAESLYDAWERGAHIFATNADIEQIRTLYCWAEITETQERRGIGSDTGCVLIEGIPTK